MRPAPLDARPADLPLAHLLLFALCVEEKDEIAVFEDGGGEEDELLLALDRALDEIEEEQRVEAIRELASPAWDVPEIFSPSREMMYRGTIDAFMGRRARDLPRSDQLRRRRLPARDSGLTELLGASMARARSSFERRRAKVWVCSVVRSAR